MKLYYTNSLIKFFFLCFFATQMGFAYLVPNDSAYKIYKEDNFQYILPSDQLSFLNIIKYYSDFITPIYEQDYAWSLDEKTSIVLASQFNQIPNAFAMTSPNSLTVYYSGGVEFLESSASTSWLYLLSTHERAHIYQLNAKQTPSKELKYIFGNDPVLFFPFMPIPIFLSPNQFLPTFIIEGNAVLNESRFQKGGRLFSGEARASVLSLIYADKADLKYIMNDHILFPYGSEKYLVGGYFQNFLAQKYGIQQVNKFFFYSANRYLNPLYLKSSFAETFFQSYETLYLQFIEEMKKEFADFKLATGNKITSSLSEVFFNRSKDESKIIFTTQPDGKNRRTLNLFDVKTNSLQEKPTLLKGGKLFEIQDQKYASVSSDYIKQTKFLYSLFDENQSSISEFEGKYVHDIKKDKISYFKMSESIDTGELYLNGEFIAKTESKSQIDENGNIYYFKQLENNRAFYKNKEKLFEFEGNYSILQDLISDKEIYFTANTINGSGLFCYCNNQIVKILTADNISRALKVGNKFLISALEFEGYSIYLKEQELTNVEIPAVYKYEHLKKDIQLVNNNLTDLLNSKTTDSLKSATAFQSYLSLREMRFSRFAPSAYYQKNDFIWLNEFSFIDPLFWSSLDFAFSFSAKSSYNYLSYNYNPYLLDINFTAINETWDFLSSEKLTSYRTDTSYSLIFDYPIYSKSFHSFNAGSILQNRSIGTNKYDNAKLYFDYTYSESYLLNYLPYRYFNLRPSIHKKDNSLILNMLAQFSLYLGADFYLSAGSSYSEEKLDVLKYNLSSKPKFKNNLGMLGFSPTLLVEKLEQHQIELMKELPHSVYYYRFPVSIRRLAPYIGYQDNKSYDLRADFIKENLTFLNIGLEAEVLLFHRIPSRVRAINSEVTFRNEKENVFSFSLDQNF